MITGGILLIITIIIRLLFFNNRLNFDIVPASVNTFFNPLIDIPLYLMIKNFNDNLNLIFAFQGVWFGGLLFVFYKVVLLFFNEKKISNLLKCCLAVCVAGGLSLIFCYKYLEKPFGFILLFTLGGLLGYLLVNGWGCIKCGSCTKILFFRRRYKWNIVEKEGNLACVGPIVKLA